MFIGHFALALGAKKFAPQVSLGVLFLACQLADIIWPNLVLLDIESVEIEPGITQMTPLNFVHYPYSHSLVMLALWSVIFAVLYSMIRHSGRKATIVIAVLGLSHWILDALTHRPDMPIKAGDTSFIGFGLWNFPVVAVPLELLLFGVGVWLYTRQTKSLNRQGTIGFWALILFLLVVYAASLLGPPPPSPTAVAWSAQAIWILIAWGFWVDRHRTIREND
jgi:membrane-bound metal-dependent hydrolase YbcI (DUF457 family)